MQFVICLVLYLFYQAKCEQKPIKSKNLLPYFRRQVEEITNDLSLKDNKTHAESHSNLVTLLIKNVKEIYNELDEADNDVYIAVTDSPIVTSNSSTASGDISFNYTKSDDLLNDTTGVPIENSIEIGTISGEHFTVLDNITSSTKIITELTSGSFVTTTDDELLSSYKNATLVSLSDMEIIDMDHSKNDYEIFKKEELRDLSKKLILFEPDHLDQDHKEEREDEYSIVNRTLIKLGYEDKLRSCIFCNNVELENCNDPKNRLMPSIMCTHDDDSCYSLHTPFGVIDRGCFNINHNITTYVCSCNLCNYISISEMPYIFAKKQDWVDNVIELSRLRNMRRSVMKEMSCLKCEANSSANNPDILAVSHCLAGNIGNIPTEYCDYNEVCAVRAIRKQGYIWRGCVKFPLFNYWWTLCDSDLCNYDMVVSIYDTD